MGALFEELLGVGPGSSGAIDHRGQIEGLSDAGVVAQRLGNLEDQAGDGQDEVQLTSAPNKVARAPRQCGDEVGIAQLAVCGQQRLALFRRASLQQSLGQFVLAGSHALDLPLTFFARTMEGPVFLRDASTIAHRWMDPDSDLGLVARASHSDDLKGGDVRETGTHLLLERPTRDLTRAGAPEGKGPRQVLGPAGCDGSLGQAAQVWIVRRNGSEKREAEQGDQDAGLHDTSDTKGPVYT